MGVTIAFKENDAIKIVCSENAPRENEDALALGHEHFSRDAFYFHLTDIEKGEVDPYRILTDNNKVRTVPIEQDAVEEAVINILRGMMI